MLTSFHLHMKSNEVCIKTRSPPASLPVQGQVTKHTTVKWAIESRVNRILQETWRYKQTCRTALIVYRLFSFFFLTIKGKRRKKKIKKRSTWVRPWLAKRKEQGFYHQLLTEISVVDIPAFPELLQMTRLLHGRQLYDFVAKISILATFFLRFFHLSRRNFHLVLATRQNLKKSHHLREQKIARVAAAISP